ncbi:N-glycosylation protein, partial [Geosmithia morbida]
RASSVPSSPTLSPAQLSSSTLTNTPTRSTTFTTSSFERSDSGAAADAFATGGDRRHDRSVTSPADDGPNKASLLQPRVAVVLNVPRPWHPWLFALRLCSILPAVWWGTPSALQLLLRLLELMLRSHAVPGNYAGANDEQFVPLTETTLAAIWCFASGYLSFFFTDCLMSRWLINYTPQATIVRLLSINAVNAYVTSTVLDLAGGFHDTRLLLPGWIGIATTWTVCYHITHQKINIRKETSTSLNVFSIASYISMVTLLAYILAFHPGYPSIPVLVRVLDAWEDARRMAAQIGTALEQLRES